MRKRFLATLLLKLSFYCAINGQSEFNVILSNIKKVSSIDWRNYKPEEIASVLTFFQTKDIVILNESDHGHGSSMDAQSVIIKELLDSSKIQSLYLESNWINCDKIMEVLLEKGKEGIPETLSFIRTYELKYWVKTGFWDYLAEKIIERKLVLKGFDIEGLAPSIAKELFKEARQTKIIIDYFESNKSKAEVELFFQFFEGWGESSMLYEKSYQILKSFIDKVVSYYESQNNSYRIKQWKSILSWIFWIHKRSDGLVGNKYANQIETKKQFSRFHSIRDSLMAEVFLSQYKGLSEGKIICSMSAYHALKNGRLIEGVEECCKENSVKTMGEIIDQQLPERIYNICFISASGNYGIDDLGTRGLSKIKKPVKGSIENALNKMKYDYCFIDFTNSKKVAPFYMNVVFNKYLKSEWGKNYSGVFYIKKMNPLNLLNIF